MPGLSFRCFVLIFDWRDWVDSNLEEIPKYVNMAPGDIWTECWCKLRALGRAPFPDVYDEYVSVNPELGGMAQERIRLIHLAGTHMVGTWSVSGCVVIVELWEPNMVVSHLDEIPDDPW